MCEVCVGVCCILNTVNRKSNKVKKYIRDTYDTVRTSNVSEQL